MTATEIIDRSIQTVINGAMLRIYIAMIGPAEAQRILEGNTNNRRIRQRHLRSLARDFGKGNYTFSGVPIIISDQGVLLDGQHRLLAVIEAGVTLPFLIVEGVPGYVQTNVDTGQKRRFGDALTLLSHDNGNNVAALVRNAYLWSTGVRQDQGNESPTYAELLAFLYAHPELESCIQPVQVASRKWKVNRTKCALAYWLFDQIDHEENVSFWRLFEAPVGDPEHPIAALQNRFIREMGATKSSGRLPVNTQLALIIKTWNAHLRGDRIKFVVWRSGGANPEKFPEPIAPIE